jgi:DNA-directed RNA polymerase specialized sigma24 family protein
LLRYLRAVAEDLASETRLDVVCGPARFEGNEASFRDWVFTVARHRVTDWRRQAAHWPSFPVRPSCCLSRPPTGT